MLKITAGVFLGIVLFLQLRELPNYYLLLALTPCLIFIRFKYLCLIGFIVMGFIWTWFRAELILSNELPKALEGELVEVSGTVDALAEYTEFGQRFKLLLEGPIKFNDKSYRSPKRIQLSWNQFEQVIEPGQALSCFVKLKRPYGFANSGGFDYEFYLFHQGIRATGYVVSGKGCTFNSKQKYFSIERIRYALQQSILTTFSQHNTIKNLIVALMIGDKSLISPVQWNVLQRTGTSHLLAISGLHIGLVFGLGFYVANYLVRLLPFVILKIPAQRIALFVGLFFAMFYAALAGFALPTQRAMIMLLITVLGLWSYNPITVRYLLSVSLLLILIFDPFSILMPGFWLSFAAVSLIIYGMRYRVNTNHLWWTWGRAQWLIMIGLMPIVIFWFQTISEFSFIANTIAIPIVSVCIVPLILLYAMVDLVLPDLSIYISNLINTFMSLLWSFLECIAGLPNLNLNLTTPDLYTVIISVIGLLWWLLPKGFPAKSLALFLVSPLLFAIAEKPERDELWLHVLDVGQGTAVLIQTRNQTVLYDTGAKFSDKFNAGSAVVIPVLDSLGISKIDKVIISHADNDHIGGLASIIEGIQVDEILFNGELNKQQGYSSQHLPCTQNQSWQKDGIEFLILHPRDIEELQTLNRNQSSCVLNIRQGEQSILLPGDIDYKIELELLRFYSNSLESDVLLVPHHGSKTSSSEPFIDTVKPKYTVITNGYRNRFGFPKQVIIDRYHKRGIQTLSTADSGMVTFRFNKNAISVTQYRAEHRRFWHTTP